jgi:hypothetical protein
MVQVLVPRLEDEKSGAVPSLVPVATPHEEAAPKKLEPKKLEPPEVPPEPEEKKAPSRILPIALLAGAGAGAVLGTATYVLYRRNNSEAQDVCPSSFAGGANCTQAQVDHHESLIDDARTMRTVSFIGFGVAGAALITAGVLTLTGRHNRESPTPPPVAASAFVGREGFAAGLSGRF